MNKTISVAVATGVLLGITSVASANGFSVPPAPPSIYDNGPASPRLNVTTMRKAERIAFSLYEGLMQATEAQIYVNGCNSSVSSVTAYVDENEADIKVNETTGIKLIAVAVPSVAGLGQIIDVAQPVSGYLNGKQIFSLKGRYAYNNKNNLMLNERAVVQVIGQRGGFDRFRGSVIKDFYQGNTYGNDSFYQLNDYGLQVLSKNGYPVNKYWQRSVAVRDNGAPGCTVFVKDRLVGSQACRITLETTGYSQPYYFEQVGTLKVEKVNPSAPSIDLETCSL